MTRAETQGARQQPTAGRLGPFRWEDPFLLEQQLSD